MNIWHVLEIEPTTDLQEIKKAYAIKLKKCKPEVDPDGFQELRKAYEIAQKYAAGIDLTQEENAQETMHAQPDQDEKSPIDPSDAVNYLLNVLAQNQEEALAVLKDYEQKGWLDNLDFSEKFQRILAIELLAASAEFHGFITWLIHYFNWEETAKNNKIDAYYSVILKNLINQTQPCRFMQNMEFISNIKNKKEAKKQDVDWLLCKAARMLIKPARPFKFFYIIMFRSEQSRKMVSLVNTIEDLFPQTLVRGFNLPSFYWWYQYKTKGFSTGRIFWNLLTSFLLLINVLVLMDTFARDNTPSSYQSEKASESTQVEVSEKLTTQYDLPPNWEWKPTKRPTYSR